MDTFISVFDQIFSRFLGVFFVAFSTVVAYYLVRGFRLGRASVSWEKVKGVVTNSEIRKRDLDGGISYYPKIIYQYRIDDRDYEGSDWSHSAINGREEEAEEILSRYEVGDEVDVYYNPLKPEQAVLEPGIKSAFPYAIGFFLAALFFLLGILNVLKFWPFNDTMSQ
jgi:hypothetical protein